MSGYNMQMWRYSSDLKKISQDPMIGHEHHPNFKDQIYGVEIKTNADGYRVDEKFELKNKKDREIILCLGDSISFGWGVEFSRSYLARFQEELELRQPRKYLVLNTSSGNYGMKNYLGLFRKYLSLKPKMIIMGFHINDIEVNEYPGPVTHMFQKSIATYGYLFHLYVSNFLTNKEQFKNHYRELYNDKNKRSRKISRYMSPKFSRSYF